MVSDGNECEQLTGSFCVTVLQPLSWICLSHALWMMAGHPGNEIVNLFTCVLFLLSYCQVNN